MKGYRPFTRRLPATIAALVLTGATLPCGVARADGTPAFSTLYYEFGGGSPISGAMNPIAIPQQLGLSAPRLPSSCDIWDNRNNLEGYWDAVVEYYVDEQLDELKGMAAGMVAIVRNADEMIAVSILQRALPGMYDWMTNMLGNLDVRMQVAKNSCEAAVAKMDGGTGPLAAWTNISGSVAWQEEMTSSEDIDPNPDSTAKHAEGDSTLLEVHKGIDELSYDTPIPWFGGPKGADPDKPLRLVGDIVSAGYAAASSTRYVGVPIVPTATFSRERLGGAAVAAPTRLSRMFPGSEDAATFANEVLGEEMILYCKEAGCDSEYTPGIGLRKEYERQYETLTKAWNVLLAANANPAVKRPTITELDAVSSDRVRVTLDAYLALLRLGEDGETFMYRYISEVALENTVDKGFALRQMITSGAMTPEVRSYSLTSDKAGLLADAAFNAIQDLTMEVEIKKSLTSNTSSALLQADAQAREGGAGIGLGSSGSATRTEVRGGTVIK